jgi:hypothetical protein
MRQQLATALKSVAKRHRFAASAAQPDTLHSGLARCLLRANKFARFVYYRATFHLVSPAVYSVQTISRVLFTTAQLSTWSRPLFTPCKQIRAFCLLPRNFPLVSPAVYSVQ